ncbi:uncharacterized protein LOC131286140 [Anopheles ziemanni]|uniref:uncharacterized protein LOC131259370 n=1 Tax=Anopheles coustani TaxID=139045 RepID=UPI00265A1C6B|nr:uncharacterized protein LOC131259370 [Anopheles coustani]XP_058171014.1 uncharacterized protein LOC131286140 [Anopheles ziemanni]
MSSASSSTAGSNAANQSGQQAGGGGGAGGGSATAADNGQNGSAAENGAEGNVVQPPQPGGGGTADPPTTSSATTHHHRGGPAASGTTGSMATVLRRKTNVCLICGIYTNLSLNIFEPRNGPNIVDVIYEKYKFRAERGDNADKHICFSCNNWLINWYSLQNTSSGSSNRTYEPAPSTSRSSAAADSSNNSNRRGRHHQGHKSRTKGISTARTNAFPPSNDKENYPTNHAGRADEQHDQVSSTTAFSEAGEEEVLGTKKRRHNHPYVTRSNRSSRAALRDSNGHRQRPPQQYPSVMNKWVAEDSEAVVTSSSEDQTFDPYEMLVKPFESRLIRMLEGQGTSVTKECVRDGEEEGGVDENSRSQAAVHWQPAPQGISGQGNNRLNRSELQKDIHTKQHSTVTAPKDPSLVIVQDQQETENASNEIVLSFDSALSEVIDVVPSLKAIQPWWSKHSSPSLETVEIDDDLSPSDPVGPLRDRLSSGALSMAIIRVGEDGADSIDW